MRRVQAATIERSIRPQAIALALFALALAITALLIVGQVATRQLLAATRDNGTLAALGMTRGQLLTAGLIEVAVAAAAGAVLACGVAVAASPLMPIGPARLAEPDPGLNADVPVLTAGFAAIVILLLARVAWPAWQLASARYAAGRDARVPGRRSQAAEWLAHVGAPVAAVTGVRLAFDPGQGRTAVPVRSALIGLIVSATAVAAAATFGANLLHLVHTPRLYGQDWDAEVDLGFSTITAQQFDRLTAHVPGLSGWTFGVHGTVQIGRDVIPAIGLAPGRGPVTSPTLLAGRAPRAPGEIVLGTSVLRRAGTGIGQSVRVAASGRREAPAVIVGRAVFPYFGQGSFTPTDLGEGAVVTAATLAPQSLGRQRPRLQLRAAPVRTRAAPGRGYRGLPAGDGRVLRHGRAAHLRDHRPAPERRHQLRPHRRHARGAGRHPRPAGARGARPVRCGLGAAPPP